MLKKSLIAIALLSLLTITVHADPPWPSTPIYGEPQIIGFEMSEVPMLLIPVRMPVVRYASITLPENVDHVNIEQVEGTITGIFEGCIELLICNNFPNMLLTAYITPLGPITAEKYLVSLNEPDDGFHEDEDSSLVAQLHLTGDLGSRILCARLEGVDPQSAPFQEGKVDCAEIMITAQPQ